MIVRQKIALVQAGVKIVHAGDGGALPAARQRAQGQVATAVIAAHKAGMDLPWGTAAAIDLAGRDISRPSGPASIRRSSTVPIPTKGRATLDGVCKNGIQLKARARVTVRTKLDRLVGGATEETIIARVGEGIVKAIGSAEHHTDVLANPNLISQAVLHNSLDSQTAFEIVSIDVAEIDVGDNIGANLQADQAAPTCAWPRPMPRSAAPLAVALEQEMRARVEENRAKVVLAEAEVPLAIAQAFREGRLGVMDYYNLRNLQSDTAHAQRHRRRRQQRRPFQPVAELRSRHGMCVDRLHGHRLRHLDPGDVVSQGGRGTAAESAAPGRQPRARPKAGDGPRPFFGRGPAPQGSAGPAGRRCPVGAAGGSTAASPRPRGATRPNRRPPERRREFTPSVRRSASEQRAQVPMARPTVTTGGRQPSEAMKPAPVVLELVDDDAAPALGLPADMQAPPPPMAALGGVLARPATKLSPVLTHLPTLLKQPETIAAVFALREIFGPPLCRKYMLPTNAVTPRS